MPYKDRDAQRRFQREWMQGRRAEWLAAHGPCVRCGSSVDLEVHHLDPTKKLSHRVWSWAALRREAELAGCVVLCGVCHEAETNEGKGRRAPHGTLARYQSGCHCSPCRAANAKYERER